MKIDYSKDEALYRNLKQHRDILNKVQQTLLLLVKDEEEYKSNVNYGEACSRLNNLLIMENSVMKKFLSSVDSYLESGDSTDMSIFDTEYHITEVNNLQDNVDEIINSLAV